MGRRLSTVLKIHNIGDEKLVEALEIHRGNDTLGTFFDCADGSLNTRGMLFSVGGVNNGILYHIIYDPVKLHVYE